MQTNAARNLGSTRSRHFSRPFNLLLVTRGANSPVPSNYHGICDRLVSCAAIHFNQGKRITARAMEWRLVRFSWVRWFQLRIYAVAAGDGNCAAR